MQTETPLTCLGTGTLLIKYFMLTYDLMPEATMNPSGDKGTSVKYKYPDKKVSLTKRLPSQGQNRN